MRLVYGAYECASARRAHTHRLGGACLVHFMTLSVTRDVDVEQQIVGLHSLLSVEWGLFYLIGDSVRSRSLSWTRNRGMAGGERQNRATANRQLSRIGDSALVSTSRAARIEFLWRIIRDAHNLLVLFAFPTSDCNALAYASSTFECSPAVASTSQMFKIDYFFFKVELVVLDPYRFICPPFQHACENRVQLHAVGAFHIDFKKCAYSPKICEITTRMRKTKNENRTTTHRIKYCIYSRFSARIFVGFGSRRTESALRLFYISKWTLCHDHVDWMWSHWACTRQLTWMLCLAEPPNRMTGTSQPMLYANWQMFELPSRDAQLEPSKSAKCISDELFPLDRSEPLRNSLRNNNVPQSSVHHAHLRFA